MSKCHINKLGSGVRITKTASDHYNRNKGNKLYQYSLDEGKTWERSTRKAVEVGCGRHSLERLIKGEELVVKSRCGAKLFRLRE